MFKVGETVIEEDIAYERFACNLSECKGACCTLPGGRGAPVRDDEISELQHALPFVRQYLSEYHLRSIDRDGIIEGVPGSFATVCVDGNACVFVYDDEGIARCALERAYLNGIIAWRKPLSCHLFPIRIAKGNRERMRYERIAECKSACEYGSKNNLLLYDFLKTALTRKYGEQWYQEFRSECHHLNHRSTAAQNTE